MTKIQSLTTSNRVLSAPQDSDLHAATKYVKNATQHEAAVHIRIHIRSGYAATT